MARRAEAPYDGKRFLLNTKTSEIHDLDNEDISETGCKIDLIQQDDIFMLDNESEVIIYVSSLWHDYLGCTKCLYKYSSKEED